MGKKEKKEKGKEKVNLNQVFQYAVEEGVSELSRGDNALSKYLFLGLDKKSLSNKANEILEYLGHANMSMNEKNNFVYEEMRQYVAGGNALKSSIKRIYERGNLEKKIGDSGFLKKAFRGNDMNSSIEPYTELANLFEAYGEDKEMPEVYGAVKNVGRAHFFSHALDLMKEYKMIGRFRYEVSKRKVGKMIKNSKEAVVHGMDKYLTPYAAQKVAEVFLFILGGGMILFSGRGMTGGVIGGISRSIYGLVGGVFVFLSLLIFLMNTYRRHK